MNGEVNLASGYRAAGLPLRVFQVVPRISQEASGPSYSVARLCAALADEGARVELHVLAPVPQREGFEASYRLVGHPGGWMLSRLCGSKSLRIALRRAASQLDVLHSHSLWLLPNVYPAGAVAGTRCRLVVSPRGTLSGWALRRSSGRKRLFWMLAQHQLLKAASCFHATSEEEYFDIRRIGGSQPVAVVSNGVDIPPLLDLRPPDVRRLLFLSRLHPKKGLDLLLKAWRELSVLHPDWELVIAGPDEDGYGKRMEALAQQLSLPRVHFVGPRYGRSKTELYASASLFILPSHSENFGLAVAEALAHGVPAVVGTGAPWAGLTQHGCGWWTSIGPTELSHALDEALRSTPQELRAMGLRGRAWMQRDFSWDEIGHQMHATYEWLTHGGAVPSWVRTD